MTHGRSPATATLAAIDSLHGTVMMARALVSTGRQVDLAGLDTEAEGVCLAVARLPATAARPLRPALEALAREVDGLAAMLPPPLP
jgi:hypothetical protein